MIIPITHVFFALATYKSAFMPTALLHSQRSSAVHHCSIADPQKSKSPEVLTDQFIRIAAHFLL